MTDKLKNDIIEAFTTEEGVGFEAARNTSSQKLADAIDNEIIDLVQNKIDSGEWELAGGAGEAGEQVVNNNNTTTAEPAGNVYQVQLNDGDGAFTATDHFWYDFSNNDKLWVSGTIKTNAGYFSSGLTGALNVLPGGTSYIVASTNVTSVTGSTGQITFSVPAAGSTRQLQINGTSNAFSASNRLWIQDTTAYLYMSGTVKAWAGDFSSGLTGSEGAVNQVQLNGGTRTFSGSSGLWYTAGPGSPGLYVSGQILGPQGTQAAPGIAYANAPDLGFWASDTDNIYFCNGGYYIFGFLGGVGTLYAVGAGSVTYPVFAVRNTNSGFYENSDTTKDISITVNGTHHSRFEADSLGVSSSLFVQNDLGVSGTIIANDGYFNSGLTGALNVLTSGKPYIKGGTDITVSTGSTIVGQITIALDPPGASRQLFFYGGSSGAGLSTDAGLWYQTATDELYVTGSVLMSGGPAYIGTKKVTGDYTLLTGDCILYVSGATAVTMTLPTSPPDGKMYQISNLAGITDGQIEIKTGSVNHYINSYGTGYKKFGGGATSVVQATLVYCALTATSGVWIMRTVTGVGT